MLTGISVFHRDYDVLRASRAKVDETSHHPRANLHTLLRVPLAEPPSTPWWLAENPLPPNLVVPEPLLLQYFPSYLVDLPFEQRSEAQVRYGRALRVELVAMLVGALIADQYSTERVHFLPGPTFNFLQKAASEGFPDIL